MSERWRLDLHVHTDASYDCLSRVDDVLRVARARGIDRVAITDHNAIDAALAAHALEPARVIVGEEVKTSEGVDVTGLFLKERIPPGLPALEVARAVRDQGGLVYVPHPFAPGKGIGAARIAVGDRGGALLEALAPWIDAVEVFNARLHRRALNRRAAAWADAHGSPAGAGSDAHTLDEIGQGTVEVPPFDGADGFLQALRAGRVRGSASGRHVHLFSTWAKLRKVVAARGPGRESRR